MPEEKIDIWTLIRKRFPAGEYALLQEVRDAAGFGASRSADGIVFSLWPSRGLEIHAIELKSYRADWLREKKNPKKAEAIFQYCDRFWLFCDDEKVVLDVAEIPPSWGYVVRKGNRLCTIKEAPKLTPEPLNRDFVAAMFKRATRDLIHPSQIQDRIDEAVARYKRSNEYEVSQLEKQVEELKKKVNDFETSAGIKISDGWRSGATETGAAIKWYMAGGYKPLLKDLLDLEQHAARAHKAISDSLIALKKSQQNGQETTNQEGANP